MKQQQPRQKWQCYKRLSLPSSKSDKLNRGILLRDLRRSMDNHTADPMLQSSYSCLLLLLLLKGHKNRRNMHYSVCESRACFTLFNYTLCIFVCFFLVTHFTAATTVDLVIVIVELLLPPTMTILCRKLRFNM